MSKETEILKKAEEIAQTVESWADLSNALFNQTDGIISRAYPTREEREALLKTAEYEKIQQLISTAVERFGLVAGATPKKSGRFIVPLPQSLHFALEREAAAEGISFNELVVAKLSTQLKKAVGG